MSEPKPQQEPSMEEILASIRRIISEDGAGAAEAKPPEPEAEPEPAPAAEKADVLELTQVVEDEENAEEPAPAAQPEQEIELREEAPAAVVPPPERVVPPPPPAATASAADSGLVGAVAAAATTAALTNLVQAVDASRGGTPIGQGTRTIEDLVKEVMRPMIRDWLDANLPRLVERLVRKEIERLSRGAEGE